MSTLYIDGVSQGQVSTTCQANGSNFYPRIASYDLGWPNATDGYFPGSLDDVRIYNRALSATEIKQLYNAGR
jgi:hypothetical protein